VAAAVVVRGRALAAAVAAVQVVREVVGAHGRREKPPAAAGHVT